MRINKKYRRKLNIYIKLLISAVVCVIIGVFIFYLCGTRYFKTSTGAKFFGFVNSDNNIKNGQLWNTDGSSSEIHLLNYLVYTSAGLDNYNIVERIIAPVSDSTGNPDDLSEMTDAVININLTFNGYVLYPGNLNKLIADLENDNIYIDSGSITSAGGTRWTFQPKSSSNSVKNIVIRRESDSSVYKGDLFKFFSDNKIESAVIELTNGSRIILAGSSGTYRIINKKSGYSGDIYIGNINLDIQKHGSGVFVSELSGALYSGGYVNDVRSGKCVIYYSNSDIYIGDMLDNKISGEGVFRWADGSSYEGSFLDNLKHGYGKYITADGEIYEGQYVNGIRNGQGKYTWKNGDTYSGGWIDDKRQGIGVYIWASGERYEGEFKDNDINGYGTYYWTDGRGDYTGYFKNGKMSSEPFNN